MSEKRRKLGRYWTVFAVLVPLLYALSYAPAVKAYVHFGAPPGHWVDGSTLLIYRPVDWLIDNTPLRHPLKRWAKLWGEEVEVNFILGVRIREVQRSMDLP